MAAQVVTPTGSATSTATVQPTAGAIPPASGSLCTVLGAPNARTYNAATGLCSASDTDTVQPIADLVITKTDGVLTVNANGSTTYTVVVTNNGPSDVTNAPVTDPAATGLTLLGWTCTITTAGTGSVVSACGAASGSGPLNTTVTLRNGGAATYVIAAHVDATTGSITNTATVQPPAGTIPPASGSLCTVQAAPNARTYNAATGLCSASATDTVQPIADQVFSTPDGVGS